MNMDVPNRNFLCDGGRGARGAIIPALSRSSREVDSLVDELETKMNSFVGRMPFVQDVS